MENIHLKTVDPVSQELLRSASKQGLELSWDRFEKLQPQDGFLRLGLSCPFGCMQGPCRIDPFGRGPAQGICGLAGDEMVAGMLLRLCLQGSMEALDAVGPVNGSPEIQFSSVLGGMVSKALSTSRQDDLSIDDIFKASRLLYRPSSSYSTLVAQAQRLSLLTLGLQEQSGISVDAGYIPCTSGYGVLTDQSIRIGLSGQPSRAFVEKLAEESKQDADPAKILVSLGDWIGLEDAFVPIGCTTGEAELLVSSGAVHLLVAGPDTNPGLIRLCEKIKVPVVAESNTSDGQEVWRRARESHESGPQRDLFAEAPVVAKSRVLMSSDQIAQDDVLAGDGNIAIIGGSDTPQLSLGHLPVELASKLSEQQFNLAGWGDAALWIQKAGYSPDGQPIPLLTLENSQGPLHAVKGLASAGQLDRLQGICFTGLKSCQELTAAIGLASLGCRVSIAIPIPIQGSSKVIETLSELVRVNGGQLLHFDHPAQAGELSEWFMNP